MTYPIYTEDKILHSVIQVISKTKKDTILNKAFTNFDEMFLELSWDFFVN